MNKIYVDDKWHKVDTKTILERTLFDEINEESEIFFFGIFVKLFGQYKAQFDKEENKIQYRAFIITKKMKAEGASKLGAKDKLVKAVKRKNKPKKEEVVEEVEEEEE